MYNALEAGLSPPSINIWMPNATAANIAQGAAASGACLSKDEEPEVRWRCLRVSGNREPAIWNLRFFKCFIAEMHRKRMARWQALPESGIAYGIWPVSAIDHDGLCPSSMLVILVAAAVPSSGSCSRENVRAADTSVPAADAIFRLQPVP